MIPALLTDTVSDNLDRSLRLALLWGIEAIVLRSVDGALVPEINLAKAQRNLSKSDLGVTGIVPELFAGPVTDRASWSNDLISLKEAIRFAQRIGCSSIYTSCFEETGREDERSLASTILKNAGEVASELDGQVVVQQEPGSLGASFHSLDDLVRRVNHPAVGFCWSPAADVELGHKGPWTGLSDCQNVKAVNVRDIKPHGAGWVDCELGEGVVDWPLALDFLGRNGFSGPLILDLRMESARLTGLKSATRLLMMMRDIESKR